MTGSFDRTLDRFALAGAQFEQRLRTVRAQQWALPTPCAEWTVRDLVNHMAQGNLNYVGLAAGGTGAQFLRSRGEDALGSDPVGAYVRSVRQCAEAFAEPGALHRVLDYPLGPVTGAQALAVRTTDSVIHTWDLARAVGADERLDPGLVAWIEAESDAIYAGLAETPADPDTTHRFFAAPEGSPAADASRQERLLHRMGRTVERGG
ncbi:MAG TPA: TIGR03086 family metal-binding protein [Actinocrinis sp.]|jgi:uncharacterized protein (TIGR03086 family)